LSSAALGGGWLGGQGSHLIDACRWLFGEIAEAAAVMRTPTAQRAGAEGALHECDAEDGFTAVLRMVNGVTAVIDCAIESSVSTPERTAVFGARGMLEIGEAGVTRRMADGTSTSYPIDSGGRPPHVVAMERYASVVCDTVRAGVVEPGVPTFADGLACAVVMDRMRGYGGR
jgi:predicted dehydrogenase